MSAVKANGRIRWDAFNGISDSRSLSPLWMGLSLMIVLIVWDSLDRVETPHKKHISDDFTQLLVNALIFALK